MLKYVYDFGETYSDCFYLVAGSESKLLESLQKILDMLDLPEKNKPESHLKVTSVRNHLSETENWLLMIDNIAEEEHQTVMNLLPPKAHGHVIMTSQRAKAMEKITGSRYLCYELKEPELDDAVELFHRSSELRRDDERGKLAKQIVKEVGLLPHAIDQSASYIKENNVSLQEYLDRYHKQPDQVRPSFSNNTAYHVRNGISMHLLMNVQILRWEDGYSATRGPVSKHFNLVFQDLAENHVDSLNILRLFSLFEPESIPLFDHWSRDSESCQLFSELAKPKRRFPGSFFCFTFRFSRSSNSVRTNLAPDNCNQVKQVVMSKTRTEKAIAKLRDLSLIRRDSEKLNFWIHDLTRLFVSRTINSADRRAWLETALETVYHCFPERDNTSQDQRLVNTYLPQAVSLIRQAEEARIDLRSYAPLLVICAQCYFTRGSYAKALEWLELARPIYEISLGAEHPRTIALEHSIGWNHRESGNPSLAETYHRRTLEARTRVLGSNAPETLESMNDLAAVIERLGKLKEAEDWFTRLYQSQKLICEPNDPRTKAAAHNLALCYANQGRLAEAEELYWVALKNPEVTSEPEDPGTLKTLGNLAATVNHLGRLSDAEALYDRTLAGYNKVFGPDHLLTLRVRSNVSALYREKGRSKEAEQMSKHVLDTFLRLVGPDNFSTAVAMYDYGEVLHEKGDLHQAKQYYELAIKVMEVGGPTHPLLLRMIDAMGILQREIGNHSEDENSSKRAYEDNMKLLGWNDPYTLVAANDYAETLQARGYINEAHDLYKKCLEGLTQLLGKEHPHSLMVLNNLGRVSLIMGTGNSLQFFSQAHEGFLKLLGEDHACTSTIMLNIARTIWSRGEREKSCYLFSLSIDRQKHALGASHPHVGVAKYFLAISLASVNEVESLSLAKNHLQECVEIFADTLGTGHQNYLFALCVLIRVLHALNEIQEAEGYTSIIQSQSINITSRKFQTWNRKYCTYKDLLNVDKMTIQDIMQILLPWGESIRLRWGRKTCWREAATPKLSG